MAKAKLCAVEGCGNIGPVTRGMCGKHYARFRRNGDPTTTKIRVTKRGSVQAFIDGTVLPFTGEDCLFWPFTKAQGRGFARYNGKWGIVTRHICTALYGPPPDPRSEAAHSCGNGHLGCVNPKHLRWATHTENEGDKISHGTSQHGERNRQAKLTEQEVRQIRSMYPAMSQAQIAKSCGVSQAAVSAIIARRRWGWLE